MEKGVHAYESQVASRPFDVKRDGFVMGEGAGILVLEREEHALARGAKIYCELAGYGSSGDAEHVTTAREDGKGAAQAMLAALEDANVEGDQVWRMILLGAFRHLGWYELL